MLFLVAGCGAGSGGEGVGTWTAERDEPDVQHVVRLRVDGTGE